MRATLVVCRLFLILPFVVAAREIHVATNGNDLARGTKRTPLRTIQRAADLAQPGDTITVHAGTYRERINPPRGGISDRRRIVYQAAPGESVTIKGSEIINTWAKESGEVWKVTLPNTFFGGFNPYTNLIHGDWFERKKCDHRTGAVYLDGHWLTEAKKIEDVLAPAGSSALWFAQVDKTNTTIRAQFAGANPNERSVEINVRQTVFYPDKPGRNFITVRVLPWSTAPRHGRRRRRNRSA